MLPFCLLVCNKTNLVLDKYFYSLHLFMNIDNTCGKDMHFCIMNPLYFLKKV